MLKRADSNSLSKVNSKLIPLIVNRKNGIGIANFVVASVFRMNVELHYRPILD